MLVMRPKKDPDAVTIQAVLWVCAIIFGALALIEKEPWAFWCLSAPCVVVSIVYALYPRGRRIVVSEDGIESVVFFVFRRFVPWDCVVSYREKKKQGQYYIDMNWKRQMMGTDESGWCEDSFRMKVMLASGLPLHVSNNFTEYKQFKKLMKEKGVLRAEKNDQVMPSAPTNDSVQEFKAQVQNLVASYAERLAQHGVELRVSKRYFEVPVVERMTSGILGEIDRIKARKREKENRYQHQRNKYHCLIVSLMPTDGCVRKDRCKDYAFILRKRHRGYIGDTPVESAADEEKLLAKIERRIRRICRQAEKRMAQRVCRDTLWDALRYVCSGKYGYKDPILGKDRTWFELGLFIGAAVLALVAVICGEIFLELRKTPSV